MEASQPAALDLPLKGQVCADDDRTVWTSDLDSASLAGGVDHLAGVMGWRRT